MVHWSSVDEWRDFIGRPGLQGDVAKFQAVCAGKSILVTGAAGSIGSLLARAVLQAGARRVVLLDKAVRSLHRLREELVTFGSSADCISISGDVCDVDLLNNLFCDCQPEIVFHAAALKFVPPLEGDPLSAIRTNTIGTFKLAEAALRYGVERLIFISTDKAVCPVNMLGASKRLGEIVTLALSTSAVPMNCVRFGNVLGSRGSVVPLFEEQIRHKGPVTVTHPDVTRYFLTGDEAVLLVLAAASLEEGGQVLVPQLGEPLKITELAGFLIRKSGLIAEKNVDIVFTRLRPGDKMAELLVAPSERRDPAIAGLLDCVDTRALPREELRRWVAGLSECVESNNVQGLLTLVREMLPDYRPSPELVEYVKRDSAQASST